MDTLQVNGNGTKAAPNDTKTKAKGDKPRRHLPSLPTASSAADMSTVAFSGLVDKTPVEWTSLKNYEVFSLSADGSFPMIKASRCKAVRLADKEVMMTGGGRCYRISLSNH
ncbi:MAG: hypothetical protein KA716_31935 [Gloeotrichia echinulata DEX184]|nr:hypothetical protein [Gloeotrichia echinulata DEX184]MCM0594547.1 hypothetical protein [Gloeotrichia echinulata DEX184]